MPNLVMKTRLLEYSSIVYSMDYEMSIIKFCNALKSDVMDNWKSPKSSNITHP